MVFGIRSKGKKDEGYASGLNVAQGHNKGLARYETDHKPATTVLPGNKKSSSRHNQGFDRYETDHPPQETRKVSRKESTRRRTLAPPQQPQLSRHTSTRASSRMVAAKPLSSSRAPSGYSVGEPIVISRAPKSRQTDRYGPTSFTVHKDVTHKASPRMVAETSYNPSRNSHTRKSVRETAVISPAATSRQTDRNGPTSFTVHKNVTTNGGSMHPKAAHIVKQFKKTLGRGSSDPRSLDEILDQAYCGNQHMSDFVRHRLGLSSRDLMPMEEILDSMEHEADRCGSPCSVLGTWDRYSRNDGEKYVIYVDDPSDPRNVRMGREVLMTLFN